MSVNERELLSIVQTAPLVVREDDGSLTLVFMNAAHSPWKVAVPLTQRRPSDNEFVLNGSLSFSVGFPTYISKHLSTLETKSDGVACSIAMEFRGASAPESRYMRKSFEKFLQNHTTGLAVSRTENRISINGTAVAVNTLFKSLNEKRNEQFISWTASTLRNQDNARRSEQLNKREVN